MTCPLTPEDQAAGFSGVVKINGQCWKVMHARSGNFVGVCDSLSLSMEGQTEGELFSNIIHSMWLADEDSKNP